MEMPVIVIYVVVLGMILAITFAIGVKGIRNDSRVLQDRAVCLIGGDIIWIFFGLNIVNSILTWTGSWR